MMAPRFNRQLSILQKHNMTRVSCVIACPNVFILLCNLDWHGRLLKLMKKVSYKYFRPLCSISSKSRAGPGTDHTVFGNNCQSILYSAEIYEEFWNLSIFSSLGLFLQVFRQAKKQLILDLHEINRMTHVVAFPMVFNLLCNLGRQGGVPKFMKYDRFKVFLAVWFFFPKVFLAG